MLGAICARPAPPTAVSGRPEVIRSVMSSERSSLLVVCDRRGDAAHSLVEALRQGGFRPTVLPDVYAAMATLARHPGPCRMILDVRQLDQSELTFLNLAPRYFPKLDLIAPVFSGTAQRTAELAPGLRSATVEGILQWVSRGAQASTSGYDRRAGETARFDEAAVGSQQLREDTVEVSEAGEADAYEPEARPSPATPPPRPARLSTDGGPEHAATGPALHEAVRMRMAGDDPRLVRRRPPAKPPEAVRAPVAVGVGSVAPAAAPPMVSPVPETSAAAAPTLLREEIDALLEPRKGDSGVRRPDPGPRNRATGEGA